MRFGTASVVLLLLSFSACSEGDTGPADPAGPDDGELVMRASGSAAPSLHPSASTSAFAVAAASYLVDFYGFWASANQDCSDPIPLSTSEISADIVTDPTLFVTSAPVGSYPCIVVQVSDVFRFVPASTEGACEAGTTYSVDTYRDGHTDFLDLDLRPVTGRGTDDAPVNDRMHALFSTNPAAIIARGFSPNQVSPLSSALVVPGTSTLWIDVSNSVISENGRCRTSGSSQGFR